jgi:hypothetical protein
MLKPKGSKLVYNLVLLSLMVPATTNLVPLFKNIVALHMTNQFTPLWLAAGANAFYVILYVNFFNAIPRSFILDKIWEKNYYGSDRVVDDLVRRLRTKMTELDIETIYGYGYRLV